MFLKTSLQTVFAPTNGPIQQVTREMGAETHVALHIEGLLRLNHTHSTPFPCHAHAVPLPCRATKGLECVFPISFTQCGRVSFTLAMPCPCHAPTMPFFSRPRHSTAVSRRPCCAVTLRRMAWSEHGMGMAWQV